MNRPHTAFSELESATLAAIFESPNDALVGSGLDGTIHTWNVGAERIYGFSTGEALGHSLRLIVPPDRVQPEAEFLNLVAKGQFVPFFETVRNRKHGSPLEVSVSLSPIKDPLGVVVGLASIARDISPNKARERANARLSRLYAAVSQIDQAIVCTPTRADLLQRVCQILVEQGGFSRAWIGWAPPESRLLEPVARWGGELGPMEMEELRTGTSGADLAFHSGLPVIRHTDPPKNSPSRSESIPEPTHATGAFPIRRKGQTCGTLSVYVSGHGLFEEKEVALLTEAASDISLGIEYLEREEARQQAVAAARSEKLFSDTMIESLPGVLYFYDQQGRFLRWNHNFEVVTGYTAAEISGMHPLDFFHESERSRLAKQIREVFQKGESTAEALILSKNRRVTPYFLTGRRVTINGLACLVGVGIDITERTEAERALTASENQLRAIFDQAPLGIAVVDTASGEFRKVNPQFCKIAGYSNAELVGLAYCHITHPDDLAADAESTKPMLAGKQQVIQLEKRYVRKDRTVVWVRLTYVLLSGGTGTDVQHISLAEDITARKEAEDRLADSERKYRELVELANSIILRWDSDGRITFLNEFGLRFFGYSAEEIIGRHVTGTIVPQTETGGRDLHLLMEQICANPTAFERNVNENIKRSGERVSIAWTNKIVLNATGQALEILSIGTDITESIRANEALRSKEEQFRVIMDNLADLVAVLDRNGKRLYNSPSYSRILGDPDSLLGSSSFEQVHPDDELRVREAFQETVRTGTGHRLEYRLIDSTGHPRYIESQGSVIRDVRGRVTQVLVVSRDVTDRRKAEESIRELNASLERRVAERTAELAVERDRAEAADRTKSAFLATMSHELRTPLNSIIGFTGILCQGLAGPLNPEQTKQLGMVRGSARHLLELINDVLDISKIEAGQLDIRTEHFDFTASLERAVASIQPMADKKGLKLAVSISKAVGAMESDRRRVEQILLNLLNNAVKFTYHGGVTIAAVPASCALLPTNPILRPAVRVSVADTGIGIKPEDLATLFQPFRQIDSSLSRPHEGTGLGLAICGRLAALLGGEISASSEWGKGSIFTVTLPLRRIPHQ